MHKLSRQKINDRGISNQFFLTSLVPIIKLFTFEWSFTFEPLLISHPKWPFSCQDSADGSTSLCCADATSVNVDMFVTAICPVGSSAYMYGSRPLACPPGSTRCPHGYACTQSNVPNLHLCCSSLVPQMPACTDGTPYIDPGISLCFFW